MQEVKEWRQDRGWKGRAGMEEKETEGRKERCRGQDERTGGQKNKEGRKERRKTITWGQDRSMSRADCIR
jgi:hypothetical protein